MIRAVIHGRLGGDPVQRETRGGKQMTTVSIAVDAGRTGEDSITEWIGVVAFGAASESLSRHVKGDLVTVMGVLTKSTFTGRDGQKRSGWSVAAEAILSVRTSRDVRSPKRRDPSASPQPRGARASIRSLYSTPQKPGRTSGQELPADRVDDLYADVP